MFKLDPFALSAEYVKQVLPLADVKAHLSIGAGEEEFDDLLVGYSAAAVGMVESYCGLGMGPQVGRKWRAEGLPSRIVLPGPNVVLTGFTYLGSDGETVTVDAATYRISLSGTVVPKSGVSWPSGIGGGIELTFSAGFAEGECPWQLKTAALQFVGHLFVNREAVSTGTISGEIPLGFRSLCSAYRPVVL